MSSPMKSGPRKGALPKEMPEIGDSVVSGGGATGVMVPGDGVGPDEVAAPAPPAGALCVPVPADDPEPERWPPEVGVLAGLGVERGVGVAPGLGVEGGVAVGVGVGQRTKQSVGVGSGAGSAALLLVLVLLCVVGAGSSVVRIEPGSSKLADAITTATVELSHAKSTPPVATPRIQRRQPDVVRRLMWPIIRTAV